MSPLEIGLVSHERTLRIVFVTMITVLMGGYMVFQARNLIQGPRIVLREVPTQILTEDSVAIEGDARNVVVLKLNGKEIHTDEAGHFIHSLTISTGYSIIKLEALDRYGRKTTVERGFVYNG